MQQYFKLGLSNETALSQRCEQATCLMAGFWFLEGAHLFFPSPLRLFSRTCKA